MEELTNNLVNCVIQSPTKSCPFSSTSSLTYQVVGTFADELEVPGSISPLEEKLCNNAKSEELGNNNNKSIVVPDKASSSNSSTSQSQNVGWLWNSSSSTTLSSASSSASSSPSPKPKRYSGNGFDKESSLPLFTLQEVSMHDMPHDCWMVLYDRVYDITCFLNSHPGGDDVMLEYAGHDSTLAFRGVGHSKEAEESLKPFLIGILVESERIWTRFFNMKSDVP